MDINDEIVLKYDEESGTWSEAKEPYITIDFDTKEDYDLFMEMIKFWNEHHPKQKIEGEEGGQI